MSFLTVTSSQSRALLSSLFVKKNGPLYLTGRNCNGVAVAIFRNEDGSLFGTANTRRVPLAGFPPILKLHHLPNADKTLNESVISFNGTVITLSVPLLGGGCTQSLEGNYDVLGMKLQALRYSVRGNSPQAIKCYSRILEVNIEWYGEKGREVKAALKDLGDAYYNFKDHENALSCYNRLLAIHTEGDEEGKYSYVPRRAAALASIIPQKERFLEAEKELARGEAFFATDISKVIDPVTHALEVFREIVGEDHAAVFQCLASLGGAYMALKDFQDAIDCYTQAQEIHKKLHGGREEPNIAKCLSILPQIIPDQELFKAEDRRYKAARKK